MRRLRGLILLIGLVIGLVEWLLMPSVSATSIPLFGSLAEEREMGSAASVRIRQLSPGAADGAYSQTELAAGQMDKLGQILRSGRKGEVHILWLQQLDSTGKEIEAVFRNAGWTVASLPIGMGDLPPGITITGQSRNAILQATRLAFDKSGIKYRYQDEETRVISPPMMGPCDVAITISTERP
jgi:hypothetical protein